MTTTRARAHVVCDLHDLSNPCPGCAGDHLAGYHAPGTRRATCRKCRAPRKPQPDPDAPPRRRTSAMPDWPALAANDTDDFEED